MIRVVGVLCIVVLLYAGVMVSSASARVLDYQRLLAGWLGFYGLMTVGVGVLIVAGGIDLSIGSVVGLAAVTLGLLLEQGWHPVPAALLVIGGSALLGLLHGLLVTKLQLQPFLVTLCGLFIYRGIAKGLSGVTTGVGDGPEVFWLKELLVGGIGEGASNQVFVLLACAVLLGLFLHGTRHGRYFFAIGANEEAARYAGIATDRYKIASYMICSTMAGVASVLYLLDNEGANASSAGLMYELYAITGAVLGGCSLRGGEGTVPGMVLGAAVLPLLKALCAFNDIESNIEYAVIGLALLLGTILDELIKRGHVKRLVVYVRVQVGRLVRYVRDRVARWRRGTAPPKALLTAAPAAAMHPPLQHLCMRGGGPMRRLLSAAALVVLLYAGSALAEPTGPKVELIYPPLPGDKCPPHPDSDTPPLPGRLEPGDTPWRYCLEENQAPDGCFCCPVGLTPQHAPEPGTLALLALGAVGLVARWARK